MGKLPLVVALHGPQRSGKNEVVKSIVQHCANIAVTARPSSFSSAMKDLVHRITGHVWTDEEKDTPQELLGGQTPRAAYIYMGQADESFGGGLWARHAWEVRGDRDYFSPALNFNMIVYESVGRQGQWDYFLELRRQGLIDTRLIEVVRPGYVYKDNRHPITDPDLHKTLTVLNNFGTSELEAIVKDTVVPWLLT